MSEGKYCCAGCGEEDIDGQQVSTIRGWLCESCLAEKLAAGDEALAATEKLQADFIRTQFERDEARRQLARAQDTARFGADLAEELERKLDEARANVERLQDKQKMAPVQGYSAGIPWSLHRRAWDAYAARCGRDQSPERIAERGGFGTGELDMFVPGWRDEVSEIKRLRGALQVIADRMHLDIASPAEVVEYAMGLLDEKSAYMDELAAKVRRLEPACEAVVATAHGDRYGLTTEDVLEAQLLAAKECEDALGPEAVAKLAARHGWKP